MPAQREGVLTELLYHSDSYLREFDASVQRVTDAGVVLNRTAFYPGGGGASRRIVALVRHSQQSEDNANIDYVNDRITIEVGNDPTHAKGGIATPVVGHAPSDTDCLSRDGDPADLRYAFTGTGRMVAGGWVLDYERPRALAFGTEQRRQ